jgi:hypothetical protein
MRELNLPIYREQIAEINAIHASTDHPDAVADFETTQAVPAAVEAAREWLEIDDEDVLRSTDIFTIVKRCLKDAKKLKCGRTVKMMTQLTAVSEYVKLRDRYQAHGRSKKPCLNASLAIAHRMGKGFYFARQIRQNEVYLLRHQRLPPSKANLKHGQYTLLDNENVIHAVRNYLAAQQLGTITPFLLCRHVNEVILPALALTGKTSISERTAIQWLKKLGYTCKDVRKGMYHDGHERPDVVDARKKFLAQMSQYER